MNNASLFNKIKDKIAKLYGKDVGTMLIHTGVIGWILSSAAQVVAIVINDKIPKEQKMFLIPQEIADAGVNIASFYLITQFSKSVAGNLLKTGKWAPKKVRMFLNEKFADKVGKADFTAVDHLPDDLAKMHKSFTGGVDVVATTLGSILSCNIVTPVIRNEIAAKRQKKSIDRMNAKNPVSLVKIPEQAPLKKVCMNDFQTGAYNRYSASSLKI